MQLQIRFALVALLAFAILFVQSEGAKGKVSDKSEKKKTGRDGASSAAPLVEISASRQDWPAQWVCTPQNRDIIVSHNEATEIQVIAISSDVPEFQTTAFKKMTISPGQSFSFPMIFVPHRVGFVSATIVVQTNIGNFLYNLRGEGIPNPFGLQALESRRVMIGSDASHGVDFTNTLNKTSIQIKEVFSTDNFLRLDLPGAAAGEDTVKVPGSYWHIAAGKQSTIVYVSFSVASPGRHSGFIHIRTNNEYFLVPVSIIVLKHGLHAIPDVVDFGVINLPQVVSKVVHLSLFYTGFSNISITSVAAASPDPQLTIITNSSTILQNGREFEVAVIQYNGVNAGDFSGKLVIRSNDTHPVYSKIEVQYRVKVLFGSFDCPENSTSFLFDSISLAPLTQEITLTNRFLVPATLMSASVPSSSMFSVKGFPYRQVVAPGQSAPTFTVTFTPNSSNLLFIANLEIISDVSPVSIALRVYHGGLRFSGGHHIDGNPTRSTIDFGVFGVNEARVSTFSIINPNPTKISIQSVNSSLAWVDVRLDSIRNSHGVSLGREFIVRHVSSSPSSGPQYFLEGGATAVFVVEIVCAREEEREGDISIITNSQSLHVKVKYRSLLGSLTFIPALIRYDPTFPGRLLRKTIYVKSSYVAPLHVVSLLSSDSRFVPVLTNETLKPNVRVAVGFLDFEPSLLPLQDGADDSSVKDMVRNTPLENRPLSAQDIDNMKRYDALWEHLLTKGAGDIRALLTLNTDVAMGCTLAVRASLTKPSLLRQASLHFPLTHLGLSVNQSIRLFNPSDQNVIVQLHLAHSDLGDGDSKDGGEDSSSFHVSPSLMAGSVIPPHGQAEFGPIFFTPLLRKQLSATLYIRNNLTLMQTVVIKGEGGSGKLVFEDAGVQKDTLNIVIDEVVLGLNKQQIPTLPPSGFEVLRTFIARNSGNLPLFIQEFSIDGGGCQKFGFRLHNCGKISLKPGEHTSFTVSYRPDFSSSLIQHQLVITSSLGTTQVPLFATISPQLLPAFNSLQPPLPWETAMRSVGLNSAVIGGLLLAAFAAFEWQKGPVSQNAACLSSETVSSGQSQSAASSNETDSSKAKPVVDVTEPDNSSAKPSQVPSVSAAPVKSKKSTKEKARRDSLEDSSNASQSVASVAMDEVSAQKKKQHQSQRDRSDSLESASSQSSTQSQPLVESRNVVSFAEKPIELDKKQSPPDLKKQAPSILKPSKSTPPAASGSDSHSSMPASSRTNPLPPSTKPAVSSSSNAVSPGADAKTPQAQSASGASQGDAKAAQTGRVSPAFEPSKSVASGKGAPATTQQSPVNGGVSGSTPPSQPSVKLPGSIAHLQPAVSAADRTRGDTLEWNVALDSSDGVDNYAAPGPSTLHSIDKMYRNMPTMPSFLQGTQPPIRPTFASDASALDEDALRAKAREKIKQFVVGDASVTASFASGAPPFVSRNPPPAVTRAFSAPAAASISKPSLASNQPWQIASFVPDNGFSSQQQSFPTPSSALPTNAISSIWGGPPSANVAAPVPFAAPLSTTSWGSFPSVSPQQEVAVPDLSGQQQSAVTEDNLFFFEDFGSTSS